LALGRGGCGATGGVGWDGVGVVVGVGVGMGVSSEGSRGEHSRKWVKHATLDDYRPLTIDKGPRAPPPLKSLTCPWGGVRGRG
jgi:hypothetical protein